VAGSPATWLQRVAIAQHGSPGSIVIGETAAVLHGLDGFADVDTIQLAVRRNGTNRHADRCMSTRASYPPNDVVEINGLLCSGLARTLCDLAGLCPERYERAADDFQRRGTSLVWLRRTAERLRAKGRSGPGLVLADLERRHGARVRDSWFEQMVEVLCQSPGTPAVKRQYNVVDQRGRLVARVDLAFPELRLAIEAHSRRFHTGPRQEALDEGRDRALAEVGWLTVYIGWTETTVSPGSVAHQIQRIVAQRAADLGHRIAS
jgi:very-short-patch-repair endonuclease